MAGPRDIRHYGSLPGGLRHAEAIIDHDVRRLAHKSGPRTTLSQREASPDGAVSGPTVPADVGSTGQSRALAARFDVHVPGSPLLGPRGRRRPVIDVLGMPLVPVTATDRGVDVAGT